MISVSVPLPTARSRDRALRCTGDTRSCVRKGRRIPVKKKTAWAINPDNVLHVNVNEFGINIPEMRSVETVHSGAHYSDRSVGTLGVYFLVHRINGTTLIAPETVGSVLEQFNLTDVSKLAFVSCNLAKKTDFQPGTEEKDRSFLYKLCKYLGEKGIRPKMAGWTDFITVVYQGMQDKANEGAV